jgi:hypothetical protein
MDYNTKAGIAKELGSYQSLYAVLYERYKRGQGDRDEWGDGTDAKPGETFEQFVVLGRYLSDQFGQLWRLNPEVFTDADRAAMPAVMTLSEFETFQQQHIQPRLGYDYSLIEGHGLHHPPFLLPPPHVVCVLCGKGWDVAHCHEIEPAMDFEEPVPLAPFVGKTLDEAQTELNARTDALRHFSADRSIISPGYVNPEMAGLSYASDEDKMARVADKDYRIQPKDYTTFFRYRFHHGDCHRTVEDEQPMRDEVEQVEGLKHSFEAAGFEDVLIQSAPVPEHLSVWLFSSEIAAGRKASDFANAIPYYRVNTTQGSLGLFMLEYPMIDLEGSGVSFEDLQQHGLVPPDFPPGFPNMIALTDESTILLWLWQQMTKRQLSKKK